MNATLEKTENSEAYFDFEIEAEKFEKSIEKSYKKNAKNYNIPGFREGSAPRAMLEAKFGPEIFLADAIDFVVPDEYYAAIKQLELKPIGEPDIEVGYILKGEPVNVKVCVPVKPEVVLGKIEGLEITVPKINEVTEKDIEKYLQALRSKNKIIIDKPTEPAALGDTVTFDYKCTVEDSDSDIDRQEDFKLVLGSDILFPGFEDKLLGVKKGDKLSIEISFPKEYQVTQLAGKKALFKVLVKKIENIQIRELNDQFAQEIANLNNLEELRSEAKKKLLEMASQRSSNAQKQAVIKNLMDMCVFSVPESVIMEQAHMMLEQFSNELASQGGSVEQYLQMNNSNVAILKKQMWEEAKFLTKSRYIFEKIIEEMGFEVNEEELNNGLESFATSIGMDKENARENLGPLVEKVLFDLKADKAAQYLMDHAVITIAEEERAK